VGVVYKTEEEIELIRISSLLVGNTLAVIAGSIKPGKTTAELDLLAEQYIRDNGGIPAFKGYNHFPASLCISINAEVVHGIPGERVIKEGDIVSVDCGVLKNEFYGDSAYTFAVGKVEEETAKLLKVTKECLYNAINVCIQGNRIGDISSVIQEHAEKSGCSVVRELVGHGIGKHLHEKPEVPNYGKRGTGALLRNGLVIAIEPMINRGKKNVKTLSDGWTVVTDDQLPSAHFEHTVAVTNSNADVLSTFDKIEKEEIKNINLTCHSLLG
jgi:methionyl aminopeptidase